MGFLGIYRAIYEYAPQSEGELSISEGDLLCVLEKSKVDDWWKAKKKASAADDDEPVGLVPNNYVEEAKPVGQARSLYEYTRQTDEELSFPEDAPLRVYDITDPDWILVGYESDFGFVPANYIELNDVAARKESEPEPEPEAAPPSLPARPPAPAAPALPAAPIIPVAPVLPPAPATPATPTEPEEPRSPPLPRRPTSIASSISASEPTISVDSSYASAPRASVPAPIVIPPRQPRPYIEEPEHDEPSPALPVRPRPYSTISNGHISPPMPHRTTRRYSDDNVNRALQFSPLAPGGFHMYNINEMVSIMGKKKKMATTLGVNLKTGVILIAPEKTQDGPTQEWTADKMTHYSREGKHVFLELVRPSKSIDFHAGAKDTAEEIVSALAELSGAVKAEGLREVIAAGTGRSIRRRGQILYDFTAQGEDEVTVDVGDEVIILDDTKSEEWWQVRRLKNGREGVVPSSYVEVMDSMLAPPSSVSSGMSAVAQNRLDEARLTRESIKREQKSAEVGPGMRLPDRQSSLSASHSDNHSAQQRSRRENGRAEGSRSGSSKPKPDPSKVRVWTDRSKSFSVEAQFLGLKDGKINLHKLNGVKIAVPLAKMSMEDIEYVERTLGISLDEEKPLADVKRARSMRSNSNKVAATPSSSTSIGASVEIPKPDYDWFQFFLACDVAVGLCERYAQSFAKDSMDQSVLPYIDNTILRNLGLREGDIIKVMLYLDKTLGQDRLKRTQGDNENAGGLFSGPGGTLRNNTRKGRPAPAVHTSDVIDAKVLLQRKDKDGESEPAASASSEGPRSKPPNKAGHGFDDDAWDVKPAKQPEPQAKPAPEPEPRAAPVQPQPAPTQAMQDLSLLTAPLEPTRVEPQVTAAPINMLPQMTGQPQLSQPVPQPQGATPSFFSTVTAAPTGSSTPAMPLNLGLGNRQRPAPPQMMGGQGALVPPPPARSLSAPQSAQPSGFAPPPMPILQPQMTGIPTTGPSMNDLNQQRLQQPYMGTFQPQMTGQGYMQPAMNMPQPTGFGSQPLMAPQMTGGPMQSPFSDPRAQQFSPMPTQPTGYAGSFQPTQQYPQPTGVNAFLPPALEPQRTGMPQPQMQPQLTGYGNFGAPVFNPAMNGQLQPQPTATPLQPQQTGPAPPIRFGVTKSLAPQPTGRRANLSQATPDNPFGF